MSMFRRPGDSSSDESSNGHEEEQREHASTSASGDVDVLSRTNPLDPAGAGARAGEAPSTAHPISENEDHARNLVLHSLLEEKALRDASEQLDKAQTDPEVQELARTIYQALSHQLAGIADERYASDQMRQQRIAAREGLENLTRSHLNALTGAEGTQALVPHPGPIRTLSALNTVHLPAPIDFPLQGFPGLHRDRYVREFVELDVVGKGGYGKVYKVKHRLDDSFYAVKRIMVSPQRLQKIKENGAQEMEKILEEVRALARFDHGNIVRYHACWLEFTSAPTDVPLPPATLVRDHRLLEEASGIGDQVSGSMSAFGSLSIGDPFADTTASAAGIVFENSDAEADTGAGAEEPKGNRKRSASQSSQATIATISSKHSRMSTIESANVEDDDIETIPREHAPQYPDLSTEISDSMMTYSDMQNQLVSTRITGPVLTLNVQMSLYDTSLAAYLADDQPSMDANELHHCFHPCFSLELLTHIISGVDYLHEQGVVHRDLKPANIFLSLTTSKTPPAGSVDRASCRPCPERSSCVHITPRIGDFGLVAALGHERMTSGGVAKPVGTEFYRPEGGDSKISAKLDVFALGVVGFEMLNEFGTRMERGFALADLRNGRFPEGFADKIAGDGVGDQIQSLLGAMVQRDLEERWSCEEVKHELERIIGALRACGE